MTKEKGPGQEAPTGSRKKENVPPLPNRGRGQGTPRLGKVEEEEHGTQKLIAFPNNQLAHRIGGESGLASNQKNQPLEVCQNGWDLDDEAQEIKQTVSGTEKKKKDFDT